MIDSTVTVESLTQAVSLLAVSRSSLKNILRLYLDLRVLCVCPPQVFSLRRVIWAASLQTVFADGGPSILASDKPTPHCLVNRARVKLELPLISPSRVLSMPLLKRLIAHGKIISKPSGPPSSSTDNRTRQLFSIMCQLCEELLTTLSAALSCASYQSALLLKERLNALTHHQHLSINVTGEYAYGRLLSLLKMMKPRVSDSELANAQLHRDHSQEPPLSWGAEGAGGCSGNNDDASESVANSFALPLTKISASLLNQATKMAEALLPSSLVESSEVDTAQAQAQGQKDNSSVGIHSSSALTDATVAPTPAALLAEPPTTAPLKPDMKEVSSLESGETYCWCDGPEGGQMICCENCDTWFHCSCVGLGAKKLFQSLAEAEGGAASYFCIACTEIGQNQAYKYAWPSKYVVIK